MMSSGRLLARSLLSLLAVGVALSSGCDDGETTAPAPAVTSGGGGAGGRFGDSACGVCVDQFCDGAIDTCTAEPACAAFLDCIDDCDLTEAGLPDAQCEAACGEPKGAAAKAALSTYTHCRYIGDGSFCSDCGVTLDTLVPVLVQECPTATTQQPCGACLQAACCHSIDSCVNNDPNCSDLVACQESCTDPECLETCYDTHSDELGEFLGGATCGGYHCFEACTEIPLGGCTNCQLAACGNVYAVCGLDPECFKLIRCLSGCTDAGCQDDCRATVPLQSLALHDALLDCAYQHCSLACG